MTRTLTLIGLTALSLNLVGCDDGPGTEPSVTPIPTVAPTPDPETEVAGRIAVPTPSGAVGITIDRETGKRYLLDPMNGLYELQGDKAELVADWQALIPIDGWDRRPYTDAVSVGGGKFAVTVESDGLLFDTATGQTTQHFCYEPGDSGMWAVDYQLTNSITYDHVGERLVAQPQTWSGMPIESSVGTWDVVDGGQPTGWYTLPWADFSAGGMVMDGTDDVLMGHNGNLFTYRFGQDGEPTALLDLTGFGVERIEGLAVDPITGNLVVLDGADSEVVEIAHWR